MAPDEPDSKPSVVRKQYDWSAVSPASAVVETISAALDRGPTSFGPLYEYIDPDALNTVVGSAAPAGAARGTIVSFRFGTSKVTVHGNGEVVVHPNAASEA